MTQDFARGLARIVADIDGMQFEGQTAENIPDSAHLQTIRVNVVDRLNGAGYKLTRNHKVKRDKDKVEYPTTD